MATALPPVAPHEAWTAWNGDPLTVLGLLALAGLYARGLERLGKRGGPSPPIAPWRVRAFYAGWAALFAAMVSPLHALGHTLLTAHMVQHLLLMVVAPPLLLAGRPVLVSSWSGDPRFRERLHRGLRGLRHPAWRSAAVAAAIWVAHLGVLWGWHVPVAYEAALRSATVHAVEHATMLGAGLLFWWAVLRRGVLRYGAGVAATAVTAAGGGALAALLTFSEHAWYPTYDPPAAGWQLTALDDQQLAGSLMWVVGGLLYAAAAAVLFAWWMQALERRARRPRPHHGIAALTLAVLLVGCQPADEPGGGESTIARGREAVEDYGCIACHVIEGHRAPQGRVGPSLHDVTERQTLAGELPNTPENLVRWIQDPQGVDPGNLMPDLEVTDRDAQAIARYLESLR
jgi:putative membrane protein